MLVIQSDVENQVLAVLRDISFIAGDREINLTDPLGDIGVSDSLALVEFVTAVEVRFQTELPETIWTDREGLTLQRVIDAIAESGAVIEEVPPSSNDSAGLRTHAK